VAHVDCALAVRSDLELLGAWRDGDDVAGNELVRRHFRSLHRFFRARIDGNVDDLLQRTFLAAVEKREKIRDDAGFKAYLMGVARRQLLLFFREERRDRRQSPLETGVAGMSGASPSRLVRLRQEHGLLLRALRKIPIDFQIAVQLYYWENMSTAEIAEVLEVAPGTVKSRLARARDMVKQHIAEMEEVSEELRSTTVGNLEGWARSLKDAWHDDEDGEPG
jgi:RNA polymerase sigma-70 factor (ECF subfamily)